MSDDEVPHAKVFRPKRPINRKTKKHIVFDAEARREFLTGFRKRKLERKKKAQEELEEQLKLERKRLKLEARENLKKLVGSHRAVPTLEDLTREEYDLENHSVSVVELSAKDLAEQSNWIGPNRVHYEEENPEDPTKETGKNEELPGMELNTIRDVKIALKKKATKEVKQSKAFQLKNKIEQQKNRKKALQQRKRQEKNQMNNKKKGFKKRK